MNEYDKSKFVVLLSAGPTARRIKKSSEYYTCGVNVTPKLIEKTDFWVVNDACYFKDFSEEELKKIENLALPEFPHTVNGVDMKPQPDMNYEKVTNSLPRNICVHPFNIHTSRKFDLPYDPNIFYFETRSSNESAVRWLLHKGFRNFISLGQDPQGSYHKKMFSRPTRSGGHESIDKPLDNDRYAMVQERIKNAINEKQALMIRLVLPDECAFDENSLKKCTHLMGKEGYYEIEVNDNESR